MPKSNELLNYLMVTRMRSRRNRHRKRAPYDTSQNAARRDAFSPPGSEDFKACICNGKRAEHETHLNLVQAEVALDVRGEDENRDVSRVRRSGRFVLL
jgi:hypothetical protein